MFISEKKGFRIIDLFFSSQKTTKRAKLMPNKQKEK
jgi:hypothetical protein